MAKKNSTKIHDVSGTACVIRGDDIDTDRIIPARYMKVITFDDMGQHLFKDARNMRRRAVISLAAQ